VSEGVRERGRERREEGRGERGGREGEMDGKDKVSNNENFFMEWSATSTTKTHLEFLHLGLCVLQVFLQR